MPQHPSPTGSCRPVVPPPTTALSSAELELPARRGFVIQLAARGPLTGGAFAGRAVHVVSGRQRHFECVAELIDFLATSVAEAESEEVTR